MHDLSQLKIWAEAFRHNILALTNDLSLKDGRILDELLQCKCLTQDECDRVKERGTDSNQIRLLIVLIKDSSPVIVTKFLDILSAESAYTHLSECIHSTFEGLKETKMPRECVICFIQARVQLLDISDYLWQHDMISEMLYSDIVRYSHEGHVQKSLWKDIISYLNQHDDTEHVLNVLMAALGEKYDHIKVYLKDFPKKSLLKCVCCNRRGRKPYTAVNIVDTCSEGSTTSSRVN